jgi:hypothetical protein
VVGVWWRSLRGAVTPDVPSAFGSSFQLHRTRVDEVGKKRWMQVRQSAVGRRIVGSQRSVECWWRKIATRVDDFVHD